MAPDTAASDDRRLFPSPDPRPKHFWNDPDGDGHNCEDCPEGSIWRCDEAAHPPFVKPTVSESMKKTLADAARARRGIAPRNMGLA